MTSLLGQKIKEFQTEALTVHAPLVVGYWWDRVGDCGEVGENMENFILHVRAEDDAKVWESLCILTDAYSEEKLASIVGIKVVFHGAHAEVTWSRQ